MEILKIYKDKKLTEEVTSIFDFGIVPAGESKRFEFWVLNNSLARLQNLEFSVEHDEVKIIEFPEEINPHAVEKLILEWNPSVTLKEGLKAKLKVRGKELWG